MVDILEKINDPTLIAVIREYVALANSSYLTDSQADRCDEILEMAESNSVVDFLIDEFEHIFGHDLNLLDICKIGDIQALLRERLGTQIPSYIDHSIKKEKFALTPADESRMACSL